MPLLKAVALKSGAAHARWKKRGFSLCLGGGGRFRVRTCGGGREKPAAASVPGAGTANLIAYSGVRCRASLAEAARAGLK